MQVGSPMKTNLITAVIALAGVVTAPGWQPLAAPDATREVRVELSGEVFVPTGVVTIKEGNSSCCRDELLRSGMNTLRLEPGMYRLECRIPRDGLELPTNLACDPVILEIPADAAAPIAPVKLHLRRVGGIVAAIRGLDSSTSLGGSVALVKDRSGVGSLPPGWRRESAEWHRFAPDAPAVVLECSDEGSWMVVVQHDGVDELVVSQACSVSNKSLRYLIVDVADGAASRSK